MHTWAQGASSARHRENDLPEPVHVAVLAAEAAPFAKVGGLADVAGALPRALEGLDTRVTLVLPRYHVIDGEQHGLRPLGAPSVRVVPVGGQPFEWSLETTTLPGSQVRVLFIGGHFFDRAGIYTDPATGGDYEDQAERWIFFCRAALAALREQEHPPDILHLNDHHTSLAAAYLRETRDPFFANTASFFSVHNLGYQGVFRRERFPSTGLPDPYMAPMGPLEFWGAMNLMKGGLVLADALGTVSPTYAREIQNSPDLGHGLETVLSSRARDLFGILNGIDEDVWNPARDPWIEAPYDAGNMEGKRACKRALLESVGLSWDPRRPLLGSISRLAGQKGWDLILGAMPQLLATGVQLVVLGSGERRYEAMLVEWARRHPDRVAVKIDFDERLAHAIEAGCDFFLMPSRYEPCGLNQMYSLRYGTVPIVRHTGGLADTVRDWNEKTGEGTGFVFGPYRMNAFLYAVRRALATYEDETRMQHLVRSGMAEDFSWRTSARQYQTAYQAALARQTARRAPDR